MKNTTKNNYRTVLACLAVCVNTCLIIVSGSRVFRSDDLYHKFYGVLGALVGATMLYLIHEARKSRLRYERLSRQNQEPSPSCDKTEL